MRIVLRLTALLLLLAVVAPACQRQDAQSTTEFDPASDPRPAMSQLDEAPAASPVQDALRPVLKDWSRRSTWGDIEIRVARENEDGSLDFSWSSTAGDWLAPEVCDLMLALRRGYPWSDMGEVHVTRGWSGGEQTVEIPAATARNYLSGRLNDPAFFSAIGVEYP